jgi:hypothetical protein
VAIDAAHVKKCLEKGCKMVSLANDVAALRVGLETIREKYGSLF